MVKFYVLRIKTGKMAVEDVPTRWKKDVEKALKADTE